jgi:DNA sulfur modification protein DndD
VRIKSLELSNFRGFAGDHSIEFSYNQEKNINIIVAENEVGKTTLLNALLFTFYGTLTGSSEQSVNVFNDEAWRLEGLKNKPRDVMGGYTEVTVIAPEQYEEKEPNLIRLRRTFSASISRDHKPKDRVKFCKSGALRGSIINGYDGEQSSIHDPDQLISDLFPEAIAKYFFFDGEGVDELSNTELLKQAIKTIQGLNPAELAIQDLDKIIERKNRDLREAETENKTVQILTEKLQKTSEKIKDDEKALKKPLEDRQTHDKNMRELRRELRNVDQADIKELESQETKLIASIDAAKKRLDTNKIQRKKYIAEYAPAICGSQFHSVLRKLIDERELTGDLPSGYEDTFVNGLIAKGVCVCGVSFSEHDEMHKNILSLLDKARTAELDNRIFSIKSKLDINIEKFTFFGGSLAEIESSIVTAENEIKQYILDKKANLELQSKIDHNKIQALRKKIDDLELKIYNNQRAIFVLENQQVESNNKLNQYNKDLRKLSKRNTLSGDARDLLFLQDTRQTLQDLMTSTQEDGLEEITTLMNKNLKEFGRGTNIFRFEQGTGRPMILKANLDEENDSDVTLVEGPLSGGGAAVKRNMFFACSLIMQSKQRLDDANNYLIKGKSAPMVVDAPFSKLDATNTKMVTKLLINTADQLIVFVSSTAWSGAIEEVLQDTVIKNKLGKLYYLKRSWTDSNDGDLSLQMPININGNTVNTGIYDAEIETSEIVEVQI